MNIKHLLLVLLVGCTPRHTPFSIDRMHPAHPGALEAVVEDFSIKDDFVARASLSEKPEGKLNHGNHKHVHPKAKSVHESHQRGEEGND